jgi:hypothetical protein
MRGWADQTVDWAGTVRERGMLKPDGVHPTDRGLYARDAAIVAAIRRCTNG